VLLLLPAPWFVIHAFLVALPLAATFVTRIDKVAFDALFRKSVRAAQQYQNN
jgi:hypothetical protein